MKKPTKYINDSNDTFVTIFEQSPLSTQIFSHDGLTIKVNKAWEKLWGATLEDIKGYNILKDKQLVDQGAMPYIKKAFSGKVVALPPVRYEPEKTIKGLTKVKYTWTKGLMYPVKDKNGTLLRVVLQHEDITEQKEAEDRLKVNQDHLSFLAEASRTLSSSINYEKTLKNISKLVVPYFADYTRIVIVDDEKKVKEIAINHIDPTKIPLVKELYEAYINEENSSNGVHKLLRDGKSEIIPEISTEIYKSIEDNPRLSEILRRLHLTSYIGVAMKVRKKIIGAIIFSSTQSDKKYTHEDLAFAEELANRAALAIENSRLFAEIEAELKERKQAENKVILSEERLRLALDAGKIGVWDWDIKNNTLVWSDRVYEFYGVAKDFEVNYENFSKFIYPGEEKKVENAIKNALSGKSEYDITSRILTAQGETKWIASRAVVTRDRKGNPQRMLGATSDVTEQKKMEQDKNDFVSIATHELKTPVTSIKAYAQVLQRKFSRIGDGESAGQLDKMNAQLDKLTSLIADLLDATKIESGKLQMHEEQFDFDKLVSEIVEELQRTTEKHTIRIEGKTGKKITADRERVGQVLTNLLSNAIKYSPHSKEIIVKASKNSKQVQLCVEDHGVGIPKRKQGQLFERFYRVSGPKEITFPGLGLGLYISSEIIKRLGGKIWVMSEENKGSTFCFTLPFVAIIKSQNDNNIESELQHS